MIWLAEREIVKTLSVSVSSSLTTLDFDPFPFKIRQSFFQLPFCRQHALIFFFQVFSNHLIYLLTLIENFRIRLQNQYHRLHVVRWLLKTYRLTKNSIVAMPYFIINYNIKIEQISDNFFKIIQMLSH